MTSEMILLIISLVFFIAVVVAHELRIFSAPFSNFLCLMGALMVIANVLFVGIQVLMKPKFSTSDQTESVMTNITTSDTSAIITPVIARDAVNRYKVEEEPQGNFTIVTVRSGGLSLPIVFAYGSNWACQLIK